MTKTTTRGRLLASSMIVSSMVTGVALAAASAGGAWAQAAPTATQTAANTTKVEEFVVTGSRIPQPNLKSVSPITSLTNKDLKVTGATDIAESLNQLPQVNVGNGLNNVPNPLSGSGGFTTVDLRNLGTVRTLVLEDGKRLMPGDPTLGGEAADLDTIPSILIDRVDVVTGGASAVYGSDAIAGVVNFIMKHDFEGVRVDLQYNADSHSNGNSALQQAQRDFNVTPPSGSVFDGFTYNAQVAVGANTPDGKGNVTGFLAYRHQDPVYQRTRDFSACQVSDGGDVRHCTGSSNSNFFKVLPNAVDQGNGFNNPAAGITYSVTGNSPNNVFTPFRNQFTTPPARFNANAFETLSKNDERYQGGFFAHYQAAPWADFYSDFAFMDDRTVIRAGPSALFQQPFNVNCDNPLLGSTSPGNDANGNPIPSQKDAICPAGGANAAAGQGTLSIGRRDVEGGARIYSFEHLSYKADIGLRGDLGDTWHYDAYAQFGRTQYNSSVQNDISLTKAQRALQVVNTGTTAAPNYQCKSFVDGTDPACVPYNIFADGGVTPAALAYILTSGTSSGDTQEQIVSGNITGDLGQYGAKSPYAKDGASISVGAEYRREQLDLSPDATSLSGDLSGAGGASPPVHGAFDVKEIFGEIRVPLLQDRKYAENLYFEGGYRFSHYNRAGDTNTYKLALDWQPIDDVRFRGSFQRAVRAPNVNELFTPQLITNTSVVSIDPCAPTDAGGPATASLAQCQRTGVTPAQYGDGRAPAAGGTDFLSQCPAGQCGTVLGGNPNLTPETSKTYSVGMVITPTRYVNGLNFSVDYFNIDVENAISTFPINIAFNDCLNTGVHCNLVVRTASGSLFSSDIHQGGYISGTNLNIGHIQTEGFDFAINYGIDLDKFGLQNKGSVAFKFNGTWTQHLNYEPVPGGGSYDCAGLYGNTCLLPTPPWSHLARLTYNSPWNFTMSLQWRFISSTSLDNNDPNLLLNGNGPIHPQDLTIGNYSYFDLSGTYRIRPGITLRAGMNNIFDKDPPILDDGITGSGTPNTFNNYDLLGRTIFVGLTADF